MSEGLVNISIDPQQVREVERLLGAVPKGWPRVASRAINKTAAWARTRIVRAMAQDIGMRQSTLRRKYVGLKRATWRHLAATVDVRDRRRIPLAEFKPRPLKGGVSYKIGKLGRRKAKGAFMATMKSGHEGVWTRVGPKSYPILELRGPSIMHVFETGLQDGRLIIAASQGRLHDEIARQVGVLLEQAARGGGAGILRGAA